MYVGEWFGAMVNYSIIIYPNPLEITKQDSIDANKSVLPDDSITYTITYNNPVTNPNYPTYIGTVDVNIIDYLPVEISSNPCDVNVSDGGVYDAVNRTVKWQIESLEPNESNSVTITVKVNNLAEPLGTIKNECTIEVNEIWYNTAEEITDVNCWDPGII